MADKTTTITVNIAQSDNYKATSKTINVTCKDTPFAIYKTGNIEIVDGSSFDFVVMNNGVINHDPIVTITNFTVPSGYNGLTVSTYRKYNGKWEIATSTSFFGQYTITTNLEKAKNVKPNSLIAQTPAQVPTTINEWYNAYNNVQVQVRISPINTSTNVVSFNDIIYWYVTFKVNK